MDCQICVENPGEETRVEFCDNDKIVTLPMCDICYQDFSAKDYLNVERV